MKRILTTALLLAACAILISLIYTRLPGLPASENATATSSPSVEIRGRTVRVTIADTPEERVQGLSGRAMLAPDEGMLFIFPEDGKYAFWMKDMLFAIDILWLSADGRIVDSAENVTPDTYPGSTFLPNIAARYVLELPAGYVSKYSIHEGDFVRL